MTLRSVPWLIAGVVCGGVGGWCYYIAVFVNNPEAPRRWHRGEIIMIGAAIGLILGLVADVIARRWR